MSFYIGKDNGGSNIVHLTNLQHSQNELMSGIKEDTIFHSHSQYLTYTNTGQYGVVTQAQGNTRGFIVTFPSSVALDAFNGKAVIVLFKRTGSSYYTMSYSTSESTYDISLSSTVFSLSVYTNTPYAYQTVDSVIAITFAEKTHNTNSILINGTGIFLNGTNALTDKYAISTSSPHNSIDVTLKLSDNLFLQLYSTSSSWLSGVKFDSETRTISRNSTNGYIPILSPSNRLTTIKKYVIGSSTHNNNGAVTAQFTQSFSPSSNKAYMTSIKCYDDLGKKYGYFNFILEGTTARRIATYGGYPAPTVIMDIKLNIDGSITCVYFSRGFISPAEINNRIVNATGFIYEFN